MKTFLKAGVAALALALPLAAQAEYPEKPVEFVVPWPPGDLEDVLTRMIAEQFQETYGVPAAVVNKPGGGGGPFPGAAEVAGADPDGYTVGSLVIDVPLVGPIIGAIAVNFGKSYFTAAFPEFWLFALGALFVATTLFLPKGIVGLVSSGFARLRTNREADRVEETLQPGTEAAE